MTDCKGPSSPLARLDAWYRTPIGREVAARESACLQEMLRDTFGYYLVQVGAGDRFREALAASRVRHRILMPCSAPSCWGGLEIVGQPTEMPLATDGVDAILLPHTLDFAADPRLVLREAERVLIPEGRVLIVGFNALSSWGLLRLLNRYRRRVPWCGRFLTPYRVEDWLSLLGFAVEMRELIVFRPPLRGAWGPSLAVLDRLGRRLWPGLGGIYVIRAVKRVSTLTPLRPTWSAAHSLLAGGAIEPSARNGASRSAKVPAGGRGPGGRGCHV
jgi:SAM-dependent methyltransferase